MPGRLFRFTVRARILGFVGLFVVGLLGFGGLAFESLRTVKVGGV